MVAATDCILQDLSVNRLIFMCFHYSIKQMQLKPCKIVDGTQV